MNSIRPTLSCVIRSRLERSYIPVAVTPIGQAALPMVISKYVFPAYYEYFKSKQTALKSLFSICSMIFRRLLRISYGIFYRLFDYH